MPNNNACCGKRHNQTWDLTSVDDIQNNNLITLEGECLTCSEPIAKNMLTENTTPITEIKQQGTTIANSHGVKGMCLQTSLDLCLWMHHQGIPADVREYEMGKQNTKHWAVKAVAHPISDINTTSDTVLIDSTLRQFDTTRFATNTDDIFTLQERVPKTVVITPESPLYSYYDEVDEMGSP